MEYTSLSAADREGIEVALIHVKGAAVSGKLIRALEADHFARTLLGKPTADVEGELDKLRAEKP